MRSLPPRLKSFFFKINLISMRRGKFLEPRQIGGLGVRYSRFPGPFAIADSDLDKIFPGISDIEADITYDVHMRGDADPQNLRLISRLAKYTEPEILLEIGTFRGKTTYNLARNTPENAMVITVALPKEDVDDIKIGYGTDLEYFQTRDEIGMFFRGTEEEKKIWQVFADSRSPECARRIDAFCGQKPRIDFAFIDGSHDYESIRDDFQHLALPRMGQGGVVVFDNYGDLHTHPGVADYLTETAREKGYVFYWYAPIGERTSCVIFLNTPECIGYKWREAE